MSLRRVADLLGRALLAAGVVVLLFAAHQLWATNLTEARAQDELRAELRAALAAADRPGASTTPTSTAPTSTPPTTSAGEGPSTTSSVPAATDVPTVVPAVLDGPPPVGDPVALLRIPAIDVEKVVVEGVAPAQLKEGPGRYPGTALPGRRGNAAIAGHRTTYGAPFADLDDLAPGDEILVTTADGEFRYEVASSRVVEPDEVAVLEPAGDDRLTLTTCHPRFSARQRLVVVARLTSPVVAEPAPAPAPPDVPGDEAPPDAGPSNGGDGEGGDGGEDDDSDSGDGDLVVGADGTDTVDLSGATSGDPGASVPALLWGSLAAAAWVGTRTASRRWRRWVPWLVGLPMVAVALFMLFEQVARLLPSSV